MDGTIYPLLDRVLDGQLEATLRQWREVEELSYDAITRRLFAHHQVEVSNHTVRRWLLGLGIDKAKAS